MKKKILFIVLPIVLAILIVGGVIAAILLNRNKSVGTTWGDTYYAFLTDAINEDDSTIAEEKYGISKGMKNAKIQFCKIDDESDPAMIMTYTKDNNDFVNVYSIDDNKKVTHLSFKNPTNIEFLYNIQSDTYGWYVHEKNAVGDLYSSLQKIINSLKTNEGENANSDAVPFESDYVIKNDETVITQVDTEGNTLTMNTFDKYFVKPDVNMSETIDFDKDIKEKELKKAITKAVDNYKKESKALTDEVKEDVSKKAEESKNKAKEIEEAKKKVTQQEDMKITSDNVVSKLGNHLKYFSACYLGTDYGPYKLYSLQDMSGKVSIPGVDTQYMMVYEVVGLDSINTLNNDLKKYMTDDVISKLEKSSGKMSSDMHEYNGKVYIVHGGIGDSNDVEWEKAKLISSEGDTAQIELEDYNLLGDFVQGKITITLKYDTEESTFKVTEYSVKELDYQTNSTETVAPTTESTTSNSNKLTAFEYDSSANNQVATGTYYRGKDTGTESILTISNATANSFDFEINAIYMTQAGYPNLGEISGTAKAIKGGGFVYSESTGGSSYGYDYNIFFKVSGDGKVTIDDECYYYSSGISNMSPYCGHNVTFEGTYSK